MKKTGKKGKAATEHKVFSPRALKIGGGVLAGVVLLVGGWFAYFALTTMPPPELEKATADDVVEFLGSKRGLARLPVDDREAYLYRAAERMARGGYGDDGVTSLHSMSRVQRQTLFDATADIFRVRVLDYATEFRKASSSRERERVIEKAIERFDSSRQPFIGVSRMPTGNANLPPVNFEKMFKGVIPAGSDEVMKAVVERTTARERHIIKPFADAVATKIEEIRAQR